MLAKGGVDICVVDADLPDADKAAVIAAARAVQAGAAGVRVGAAGSARLDGVDGMLPKPVKRGRRAQAGRNLHPRENPDAAS